MRVQSRANMATTKPRQLDLIVMQLNPVDSLLWLEAETSHGPHRTANFILMIKQFASNENLLFTQIQMNPAGRPGGNLAVLSGSSAEYTDIFFFAESGPEDTQGNSQ